MESKYTIGYTTTEESLDLSGKTTRTMTAKDTAKWLCDLAKKVLDGKVKAFSAEVAVAQENTER